MKNHLLFSFLGLLCPLFIHAQWISQATGFTTPSRGLWDISIADENTAWALAYNGTNGYISVPEFTKTIDGGATWIPGSFPVGYQWVNISAINGDTAWIAVSPNATTSDGAIFKTTDGGDTWNEQGVGMIFNSTSFCNLVYFWNVNEGVAIGDPNPSEFEIYTTIDGGDNWTPVPGNSIPNPVSGEFGWARIYCTVGNDIWFSTNKLRVFHSADKGLTWSVSNTGIPVNSTLDDIDIAFWNANEGIARKYDINTNSNLYVSRTNDGGTTWNPVTVSGTFFGSPSSGVAYVPGTTSTLVSTSLDESGGSSYSNDGGSTWTLIDTSVRHFVTRFWNNTTGWSAGFNLNSTTDGIFKYDGVVLNVKNSESGREISFNTYPNPGNGQIMVQLNNGENSDLQLSVFDLSGRIVYKKDFGVPGEFFLQSLDLSGLAKGIYVMKIENGMINHSLKIMVQ